NGGAAVGSGGAGGAEPLVCRPGDPTLTLLAGAVCGPGQLDRVGAAARFTNIMASASDGAGNLFVADGDRIRRVVMETGEVTTVFRSTKPTGALSGIA